MEYLDVVLSLVVLELDIQIRSRSERGSLARGKVNPARRLMCGARDGVAMSTNQIRPRNILITSMSTAPPLGRDNTNREPELFCSPIQSLMKSLRSF